MKSSSLPFFALIFAGWLLCPLAQAQQPANTQSTAADSTAKFQPWTPEDEVLYESAGQARISPDGQWAVWVKDFADKDKDARFSNLYLTHLSDQKTVQLTRGSEEHTNAKWSPSGKLIAFLSDRKLPKASSESEKSARGGKRRRDDEDGSGASGQTEASSESKTQIWLIDPAGGEPWPLTKLKRDVTDFAWAGDDTVVYSTQEDAALYEQELQKKKDDSHVPDDEAHEPPVRLFQVSVKEGEVKRLTHNNDWIRAWDLSPDGKCAVAIHQRSLHFDFDENILPSVVVHDLATGKEEAIFSDSKELAVTVLWARDGAGVYAVIQHSKHPHFHQAYVLLAQYWDLAAKISSPVDLHWERGLATDIATDLPLDTQWAEVFQPTNDGFFALLANGFFVQPAIYKRNVNSWTQTLVDGQHKANMHDLGVSRDAKALVYEYSTSSTPPQWFAAKLDGAQITSPMQFTDLNPQWKNRRFPKTELIRWKGAREEEIEGILYYPFDYQPGKRYPLITGPHGGPASADYDMWNEDSSYPSILHVQRGAFYIRPNYHGSAGYGLDFVESIGYGNMYDLEIPDIEKGVDFLIAKGYVDPERIGAGGWSYGCILTAAQTVENPARYKAASCGAGDVEYFSDWGNTYYGNAGDAYYFGKTPFEDPLLYVKKSPFFRMDRVTTPTIIYTPTDDVNVPPDQGWSHFRAMQYFGKAPVKFVVFPGEPHSLKKLSHRIRKVEEDMAWFDKYLYIAAAPESEAVKAESPMKDLLRKESIARENGFYGVSTPNVKDKNQKALIPETVARGELKIGRFEVTRAQFATFRLLQYPERSGISPLLKNELVSPAGNLPVSGVSLGDAKAYVKWLSAWTGETWRLPNEEEVKDLYENRDGENTLDYWAGYAPNPEDAARLRKRTQGLADLTPLLKEVGSFRGQGKEGEEPLYDLGGNVAEWVLTSNGNGKAVGGSADCPVSPKANCTAAPEYTGFRVVHGAPKDKQ